MSPLVDITPMPMKAMPSAHPTAPAGSSAAFPGPSGSLPRRIASMMSGARLVRRSILLRSSFEGQDDSNRVADSRSLSHTFITNLANGGVRPKVAQSLARGSSITLTMDRYSPTLQDQHAEARESLPCVTDETNAPVSGGHGSPGRPAQNSPSSSPDSDALQSGRVQSCASGPDQASRLLGSHKFRGNSGFDNRTGVSDDNESCWRGGRAAEGTGLLNRRRDYYPYRGFESRPLRFRKQGPAKLL